MTMKKIKSYTAGLILLLIPVMAGAQALPFTAAETDAASLRKAGADIVETGSIANAAFRNASAIPFYEGKLDVEAGYTAWSPSNSNIMNVAGAYNINDRFGVAAGFSYGMLPAYDVTDGAGISKGTYKPSDMQINAGFAYKFLPYLSAGINIGYASSNLAEGHSYGAVTSDVFLMGKFSDFKVAAGVSNLGTGITSASGAKFKLPTAVSVGAGYENTFADKHGISANIDADYFLAEGIAIAFAAQYSFDKMVYASAGYRYGGNTPVPSYASVGLGAAFKGIKLDLAYLIGSDVMANTLAIGLGYCF